jgi:AraC-like DNA-binding protein
MATHSEPPRHVHAFNALFANGRRQVSAGPGGVREVRLELDGPPLRARSRLLSCRDFMFVRGENQAREDMLLRNEGAAPLVAVQVTFSGTAVQRVDGLSQPISASVGSIRVLSLPSSNTTVSLRARERNEAFRINIRPAAIVELAARHPPLEELAARVETRLAFCAQPTRVLSLAELGETVASIMNSEHYGELRPLFLEARALEFLAMALASSQNSDSVREREVRAAEVDRMHAARSLLLSRISDPPSLAELARTVGTNEFALKRHFKATFGKPVHAYLLGVRLAHASELLKDTELPIKQIASAVGYTHANHFATAFQRMYGISPARFRRSRGGA